MQNVLRAAASSRIGLVGFLLVVSLSGCDTVSDWFGSSKTPLAGERVPVFVVVTEYDNPGLDVVGAELLAALCARDGACPRFSRLEKHNHLSEVAAFNTADEQLGREILEFMRRGR